MTNLIYRGMTHNGQQPSSARMAQTLIYRGVLHDGLSMDVPTPSQNIAMHYRGVAYTLGTDAARSDTATLISTTGQISAHSGA